jgi:hypothetical protein
MTERSNRRDHELETRVRASMSRIITVLFEAVVEVRVSKDGQLS